MLNDFLPEEFEVSLSLAEFFASQDHQDRRLYLNTAIGYNTEGVILISESTNADEVSQLIIDYNREDKGKPVEERRPIRLYIDSPGGDLISGFGIIGAIKVSKTPVYTINVGQWSSVAFLIGICGHRRFSLPDMTFLMHDGHTSTSGSTNKTQDTMKFSQRFEDEVVKTHVLEHSNMTSREYDALSRVEYYMLPEDALEHGFIDEIVTDVDTIL